MKRYVLCLCTTALLCAGLEGSAYGQASSLGASFLIFNPGSTRGSDTAYDTRNNVYLVVTAFGAVTGQFVSADGVGLATCGGPFVIGGNVFAHFPRAAYSPDANGGLGGFVVTWHDGDSPVPGGGNAVHARAVSLSSCLGTDRIISNTTDGAGTVIGGEKTYWEQGAAIAYSTVSQRFLVVWHSIATATGSSDDIAARLLDSSGQPLGAAPIRVTADTGTYERDPSVAYNPATNQFLVAYAAADTAGLVAARTVSAATGAVGPYYELTRGVATYITDTTFMAASGKFLVAWYQNPGGSTAGLVDGATGVPDGSIIPLSTRFAAYDAIGVAYNPISTTAFMVSQDQSSFQNGGLEISSAGVPGPGFGATFILDRGNFYPRITSSSVAKKWLMVTSQNFQAIWGQFIQTSSSGSVGAPPPPPPPPPPPAGPTVTALTPSVALPVSEGTSVTWTAAATGGTAPLQYQFVRFSTATGWVVAQPYSSNNTYSWFPPAGSNALQVWVRSSGSTNAYDAYLSTGMFTVLAPAPAAKLTSLTSSVAFPTTFNTPITFTAAAGPAGVQYKFLLFSGASGWRVGREYGSSNAFTWFPPAGQNAVQVWVRSASSSEPYQDYMTSGMFTVAAAPARVTGLSANVPFPTSPNTTITWTASAIDSGGGVEYKFLRYDQGFNTWSVIRDWSTSNQFSWTPGVGNAGWSAIQVWVRSVGSSAAFEDWKGTDFFLITNSTGLTLTQSRSATGLRVGDPVTWTATASGTGPWEYQFFTFDGTSWRLQQPYSTVNTFTWFPPAGTVAMQVWIRAAGSHAAWERYESSGFFIVNP